MYLTALDFVVIAAYLVGLTLLGVYFSRRQTSEESYFLGNRRMPWLVVGVSVMATLVSTLSYLSTPGEMIKHGLGYFALLLGFIVALPLVNRLIIPALMRLPVTTVYEYFEKRFSPGVRSLGAVVFIIMRLTWIGLIIYTASFAVTKMTQWDTPTVILVVGVVTTFYTTAGGMQAVVWSDFMQGILLVGGAMFIPAYIAWQTHSSPVEWWDVFSQAGRAEVPVFSWDPFVRITMVGVILEVIIWNISTHSADQVAAQRYLSTPSVASAQRSFWMATIFVVVLMLLLMLVGLALFYFYYEAYGLPIQAYQSEIALKADDVLPEYIAQELPAGISGLLLAALLAAAMSSLSSGINSISSVLMTDFIDRFGLIREGRKSLMVAMGVALLAGVVGIGVALGVNVFMKTADWNLVEMAERINHVFVAPLGALFIVGLFSRRVGATAALLGFAVGTLSAFLISFSEQIFRLDEGISFNWIMPGSFIVSMAVSYLAGHFLAPPSATQLAVFGKNK